MIVGLTGGIGSGKTTVAKLFSEYKNVAVYIADIEAKKLMNSSIIMKSKIIKEFGEEAYKDNQLNREFIANIVFNDKEKLTILNSIVHPEVKKHFQKFVLKNTKRDYILYENAILFESNNTSFCDVIISVFVPLKVRIQRVISRDNTSESAVLQRMKNQWLEAKKLLQSNYIICNIKLEDTKNQVAKIHNILTKNKT
ncbi:dephospho-CoA kinase [Polaribacter sp. SA4-10]|uniref:dephospho-CoA kinase n=1 Tax=Polaribacter sp. SA4-10 TaxID=754397 RepID=UPI000B3C108A|nr:dephospho-CoA kinase [Polaribacter sp. SA4-10]ARV05419.1 dephospho-CoA kinase [Polaribacter sp. SA4-10]